jgi:hypothetical protein
MAATLQDEAVALSATGLTNAQVADELRARHPNCRASAASVSSMLSRARSLRGPAQQSLGAWLTPPPLQPPQPAAPPETPEERSARLSARFAVLDRLAHLAATKKIKGLVVAGPPGLGKSHAVVRALRSVAPAVSAVGPEQSDDGSDSAPVPEPYEVVRGALSAPGLYLALYRQREGVLLLDDCDDALRDETALNLLKAVLDTGGERLVGWRRLSRWLEDEGVPREFEFRGTVVFCTNLDFEAAAAQGGPAASHVAALLDRSLYLSLTAWSREDLLCRLRQVAVDGGMLREAAGLSREGAEEAMAFVEEHAGRFYRLSLRLMLQVGDAMARSPDSWQEEVEATRMRAERRG